MAMLGREPYDWQRDRWDHPRDREWPPPSHTWAWLVLLAAVGAWLTAVALIFAGRIH